MDDRKTSRLEAFSDGVFAVAITLLILNISIPDLSPGHLPGDAALWTILAGKWPALVAYVTSFFTIGVMWLNHHRLFVHIRQIDTVLLFLNLLLLSVIVFIPFPTSLLAEYITSFSDHAAAILYSGVCLFMAICFNGLWHYASYHSRLLGENVDENAIKAITRQYYFGPLGYLVLFGIAWINTFLCVVLICVLALFFALPSRVAASLSRGQMGREATTTESEQLEESEL